MGRYLTCTDLFRLAIPKSLGPQEFEPGTVSTLAFTGTGTGTLEVAWPRDTYAGVRTTIGAGHSAIDLTANRSGISVQVVVGGVYTTLLVSIAGNLITLRSATDGGGLATTTGAAALAEILLTPSVMAVLQSAAATQGSNGTAVLAAVGSTPLLYPAAVLKVSTAGDPGAGLRLALSLDGGTTWGPSVVVPAGGVVSTAGRELELLAGGTGFVLGDRWAFTTTASPEISQHLAAAEDEADGYIPESLRLPLTATNQALRLHLSGLCAWSLMKLRGIDPKSQDFTLYRTGRTDGIDWLTKIATGQLVPTGLTETPPGVSFADLAPRIPIYNRDFPLPP